MYTDAEEPKGWTVPVNKLLPPSTPSIVFALPCELELDIINSFPLPAGTVLGYVNTGPGRDTARHSRGRLLFRFPVWFPRGCGCRSMSETQCHSPSRALLGSQWEDSGGPASVCHHPAGGFLHTSPSPWQPWELPWNPSRWLLLGQCQSDTTANPSSRRLQPHALQWGLNFCLGVGVVASLFLPKL